MKTKNKKKKTSTIRLVPPPVTTLIMTPEEMTVIADAAVKAAQAAAPGFDVIVLLVRPDNAFRVNWGSMVTDRAGWLLYRALIAVERMIG